MQILRFIFLQRNWAADREPLSRQISRLARGVQADEDDAEEAKEQRQKKGEEKEKRTLRTKLSKTHKLLLLIFPEGNLVSKLSRPVSKKFADKMGYQDPTNLLLPRSTGLFFSLRALAAEIDDLYLLVSVGKDDRS